LQHLVAKGGDTVTAVLSIVTFTLISSVSVNIEAMGGAAIPGNQFTDTPAIFMEFRPVIGITEDLSIFFSVPYWKLEDFDPTSDPPDELGYGPDVRFSWFSNYYEESFGIQLGARYRIWKLYVESAVGRLSSTLELCDTNVGKNWYNREYTHSSVLCSFAVYLPAGENGFLSIGARALDSFSQWQFTAGGGISIRIFQEM
jgi:hypothetical protein